MKKLIAIVFLALFVLTVPQTAQAAGLLSFFSTHPTPPTPSSTVIVKTKVSSDKHYVTINFSGLRRVSTLTYILTYQANGQTQGVVGTIIPNGQNTATRTIFLGTCSVNSCIYHTNITNMVLEVTGQYTSGQTFSKTYNIKI